MRYCTTLFIFLFISSLSIQSQTIDIKGAVKDASGSLTGVVVTVTTESKDDVLAYTITDSAGEFLLKNVDMTKGKFIRARLMGYANQKIALDKNRLYYSFLLTEESIELNEVLIKSAKISGAGDTTRYLASSFAKENDITLGDVLKRMPGFNVSDEGKIKFQGKDLSNFYIEGSNIMGAKYPVAVNSISHDDVGSVEVIENHQSIKLFEDLLFSDNTALNITLKEKAKNRWVGLLNVGGGIPSEWSADVNAMRFAQKVKMLNTYKGNNTGHNVAAIAGSAFSLSGGGEEVANEIVSQRSSRNPFLEERKTLFNKSHMLSLNNQALLSKSFILTPQLEMSSSIFDNDMWEKKSYFLANGETLNISTQEKGKLKKWDISPTIRLEANTAKMYFNNVLSSTIKQKENDISIVGTYPNQERSDIDYLTIGNNLDMMFRMGKKVIGLKSVNNWSRRPQSLNIRRDNVLINEEIETSVFNSNTSATQSFVLGRATLSLEEGFSYSRKLLESTLTGIQNIDAIEPFDNNFDYRKTMLYVKPSMAINWGAFRTTLGLPVSYNRYNYTDKLNDKPYLKNKWLISPTVSARWAINKKYTISVNGGWKKQPESNSRFYTSPMLSSYPFIQTGTTNFNNAEMANVGVLIRYKKIIDGLFWNASYNRFWWKGDLMSTQDFKNEYIIMGLTHNPYATKTDNVVGNISYMIGAINGGASLRGLYSHSDSYFMQSGSQQYSTSSMKQVSLNVYSSPLNALDIDYTIAYSNNNYQLEGKEKQSSDNIHQKLSLTFIPIKKLNVVVTGNNYYNTLESGNKNTLLVDADLNYRFSSKWSFRLSAQNLFNQREFSYISYTDMMSYERKYRIRPFSLLLSVITSF